MQKITSLILLLAFLGQTFNQGFFYLDYLVDKAAYEKKCINKARPQLHCNGKCQLMKKIKEQEEKERRQAPELKLASKTEVLSSKSFFTLANTVRVIELAKKHTTAIIGYPVDQPSFFFHPPAV